MIRQRIHEIIDNDPKNGKGNTTFGGILTILIWLNIAAVFLGSVEEVHDRFGSFFAYFEIFSVTFFTIEYLLRLYVAPCKFPSSKNPFLRYVFSFIGMIDLFATLPFFLPFVATIDLRVLRILRMFRLLRILKLTRYNNAFRLIVKVFRNQKEKLGITIFFMGIMFLLASSIMFFMENAAQPDKFPNIPATMWWAVGALTTVGYGDVYPVTLLGRTLGGIIAILGIGLIAMPSGIISMGLITEVEKEVKNNKARRRRLRGGQAKPYAKKRSHRHRLKP